MKKDRKKRLRRIEERRAERRERHRNTGELRTGTLKMTQSGFGFVTLDPDPENAPAPTDDVFIPAKFVGSALDGDRVRVELLPPRPPKYGEPERGPAGKIVEVIERKRNAIVGELLAGSRVRPLNSRLPEEIFVRGARRGATRGDWVKLRLDGEHDGEWYGAITGVIGRSGVIAADLDAVLAEYDLKGPYTEAEDAEALAVEPREITRSRRTDLFVITIDPFDAKDFDDALSLRRGPVAGTVELGVHISDVAAYIPPKSKFDQAAASRGMSCYLPGRTLPMLPKSLTAKISLQQGELSRAHSVFLTVDKKSGRVLNSRREHTLIKVNHRLNYDEVQDFVDGVKTPEEWDDKLKRTLKSLVDLTRRMRACRAETEQFIELPLPEIRVLCDEQTNQIQGINGRISREAENLVEECMLAANSAVGTELVERGIAGIYRVHPEPDPEKSAEFNDYISESFGLNPGDITNRAACNKFIKSLPDDPRRSVILSALLRSLPRASYSDAPEIHFALGKFKYCHFTSPIRRYPDLTVHQQLWSFDSGKRTRTRTTMEHVAQLCSELEESIDAASFAANDRLKLRYLEERLESGAENLYEGVIARVLTAGLQVEIGELGLYGFVPRENLFGEFSRRGSSMRQSRGSRGYKPGDYIYLQLARIDFSRGSAIFVPAGR